MQTTEPIMSFDVAIRLISNAFRKIGWVVSDIDQVYLFSVNKDDNHYGVFIEEVAYNCFNYKFTIMDSSSIETFIGEHDKLSISTSGIITLFIRLIETYSLQSDVQNIHSTLILHEH